jgi:hypothetical protein
VSLMDGRLNVGSSLPATTRKSGGIGLVRNCLCYSAISRFPRPLRCPLRHRLWRSFFLSALSSLLVGLPPLSDSLQYALAVLVHLQLDDVALAGMNADGHALAIGLLPRYSLNVDDVF